MIKLGTKAETLLRLSKSMKKGKILPQITFTIDEWETGCELLSSTVFLQPWCSSLVVRSSALDEDTVTQSQAGKYDSILNVCGEMAFREAVENVIDSFDHKLGKHQILVQPMLKNIKSCGVAFTIDPNTRGNYYVINYDESGSTSSITSGNSEKSKLFYCFKEYKGFINTDMHLVCDCLKEIEELFGHPNLDVEFAITEEGDLYIFQVRTLCIRGEIADSRVQQQELSRIYQKVERDNHPMPFLNGRRTIFGVMPDWNPAEMIGIRPKPLALSLYREIITDNIWAYQRHNYGYKNLRSFPLMVDFCGLPYIDVRVSFNSFIPRGLSDDLSEKLINYYLDRLIESPSKHDKVEFEIIFSCYTLDLPERIQILTEYGFTQHEIEMIVAALKELTNHIIDNDCGLWKTDYEKIKILEKRYEEIVNSSMNETSKIYWLLEDCKRYGTLPFAGLARAGFVAVQILNSLVAKGIISRIEFEQYMNDLNTVSTMMNDDIRDLSREAFLKKYGHLRPGTYDISSRRYDEEPELYFSWDTIQRGAAEEKDKFRLSLEQMKNLREVLVNHGLSGDIIGLFDFIKVAIEGREYAKFIFTKSLSEAIRIFGELGQEAGFTAEECAYANIQVLKELYSSTDSIEETLKYSISKGKAAYKKTEGLTLPPVMFEPKDVYCFYYPDTEPNYITMKHIKGELVLMDDSSLKEKISGKILLIQSADPGYDWIFSHGIGGFITKFGGANSHMAIRAGELGIPAVIGAGEKMFERLKEAEIIEIDALAKKVMVLK